MGLPRATSPRPQLGPKCGHRRSWGLPIAAALTAAALFVPLVDFTYASPCRIMEVGAGPIDLTLGHAGAWGVRAWPFWLALVGTVVTLSRIGSRLGRRGHGAETQLRSAAFAAHVLGFGWALATFVAAQGLWGHEAAPGLGVGLFGAGQLALAVHVARQTWEGLSRRPTTRR